jgi:hypothetical protein
MTFRQLASTSAARGGMEKTVTFTYDENVATVMAAFRERTQTPHASMPVVHRVDILEERLVAPSSSSSSPDRSPGWSHRVRRFYAANDAPDWIRRITGGDYLTGTERIEWSETLGRMVMYTANESHAHLVAAEEVCVIERDPDAPETRTIKTLTVRARLRMRGWWTLGLSNLAERFLLRRYEALVEQGRRIELAEIARWRKRRRRSTSSTAEESPLAATAGSTLAAPPSSTPPPWEQTPAKKAAAALPSRECSPVSTLRRIASGASSSSVSASVDGLGVESLEAFERAMTPLSSLAPPETSPSENLLSEDLDTTPRGLREEDWLSMRYEGSRDDAAKTTDAPRAKKRAPSDADSESPPERERERVEKNVEDDLGPPAESPLHVPLREDSDADRDDQDDASVGGSSDDDDAPEDDRGGREADARSNRGGDDWSREGFAAEHADADWWIADDAEALASVDHRELERLERDAIARKLGMRTPSERRAAASLFWRKLATRLGCAALAMALARERRAELIPLAARATRGIRRRRGGRRARRDARGGGGGGGGAGGEAAGGAGGGGVEAGGRAEVEAPRVRGEA